MGDQSREHPRCATWKRKGPCSRSSYVQQYQTSQNDHLDAQNKPPPGVLGLEEVKKGRPCTANVQGPGWGGCKSHPHVRANGIENRGRINHVFHYRAHTRQAALRRRWRQRKTVKHDRLINTQPCLSTFRLSLALFHSSSRSVLLGRATDRFTCPKRLLDESIDFHNYVRWTNHTQDIKLVRFAGRDAPLLRSYTRILVGQQESVRLCGGYMRSSSS